MFSLEPTYTKSRTRLRGALGDMSFVAVCMYAIAPIRVDLCYRPGFRSLSVLGPHTDQPKEPCRLAVRDYATNAASLLRLLRTMA